MPNNASQFVEYVDGVLVNKIDRTPIFLGNNEFLTATYTNPGSSEFTLLAGVLMGRVATTNKVLPCESDATDGSQFPIGVLAQDYAIGDSETKELQICNAGEVAEGKIVFGKVGDDFDTVVGTGAAATVYRDLIASRTAGIILVKSTDLTKFDN